MSTSPYLVAAYLGSATLYGGYLVHLVRRRRVLTGAVTDRRASLAGREATSAAREATSAAREATSAAREATSAARGAR